MKKMAFLSAVAAVALTGCAPLAVLEKAQDVDAPVVSCEGYVGSRCAFDQAPLRVLNEPIRIGSRPYQFFPTASQLNFVDADGSTWLAPRRTLTDGASIPQIFISIVGDPTSREFINAAALHDAYCGVGNEAGIMFHQARWQDVHKMFYDGLVVGGTDAGVAKLMFAAVWLGGPRWETNKMIDHVPVERKQRAMRKTKSFIERSSPSLGQLIRFLEIQDADLLSSYPRPKAKAAERTESRVEMPDQADVEEDFYDDGYDDYFDDYYGDYGDYGDDGGIDPRDPSDPGEYGDPAEGGVPAVPGKLI